MIGPLTHYLGARQPLNETLNRTDSPILLADLCKVRVAAMDNPQGVTQNNLLRQPCRVELRAAGARNHKGLALSGQLLFKGRSEDAEWIP
ncbi:MAG: hypothetical protein A3H72_02700 [Candidatus Doudnabacteria bacterium RIFCSPLOWO2_02_FULL_48_8]|uniref:Uncharacterized protein n=1 Tax=Candidatus Doudnabacteria bacterium RIFCSPHIGHO2_01_FULL_46_24 TaxID=1817825 RepID=A0A1F5NV01_9BACT|nr:MAG: hypothetical protein A2720_03065 [Candidatus Doudnabacteria bacterium RIFCSPHIGHO2_01_FULL_46_24]OGE95086.1 MAG: hypothetical protein A3H72_02700 [Candidatus Doudnabacteria bacterium RIFCSPLOWO2_02_FULL_48_8]OGE95762.1 MAG: hypothetical protein A3E98_02835 [Candidatus Doudnabacteria bacterium RIFCSPHIGHO2_12_FULL_48_11]